ncbi:TPA: type II secretion system protein [Vibrio alginolyticus]|uniref:prepilin-type N-terminal cleavage/methylation domain-containing protein n=1 Tax=Vibrio harveyi group TaxID=717610 RepID=UPI001110EAD5|nr:MULTISPECIES: type II secretion system protein [Vibrio harveyi group]MCS0455664.1 type II secretion system GspH family protein [Vibrio diabolicus]TMX51879.1 MSHA biogenesis protein MshA [Vibrio alginolyticus]TNC04810.1 type II secretion system protein [Vibrio diabolicus]
MKRQGGFTLIELVVVIVILGILAVTAAPRFLNLQDDARNATLEGLSGAIQGAVGIVYGKAAIQGVESADVDAGTNVALGNGQNVLTIYGYPLATSAEIEKVVDGIGTNEDFQVINTGGDVAADTAWVTFGIANYTDQCVKYTMAANANTPAVVEISTTATECTATP